MLRNAARAKRESDDLKDAADAAAALAALSSPVSPIGGGESGGMMLAFAPYAENNMVQSLLYSAAWQFGIAPLPCRHLWSLPDLKWRGRAIYHFHWLAPVTAISRKRTIAESIETFARMLATLKGRGGKLVWTVHNVIPHDTPDIDAALEVRRLMVREADAIHVMNPETPAMVAPHFSLEGKQVFQSPHPSYLGAYPDYTSRENARFQLGLEQDAVVFLCFGAIQKYKGVDDFVAASAALKARRPNARLRFVIAGPPQDPATARALVDLLPSRPDLIGYPERVPVEDVQYYFRAADFVVCPYRSSLNSGTAMLAFSFGVPVVAPETGPFPHLVQGKRGLLYPLQREQGLLEAMSEAVDRRSTFSDEGCRAFAERLRPVVASRKFFQALLGLDGFRERDGGTTIGETERA